MPKGKHNSHLRGKKHPRWSNSKMLSHHGYVKIRVGLSHPLAAPNGYAYEQILVWVSAGNPRPPKNNLLHHKNGDRTDNRIDNLELMEWGKHTLHHTADLCRDELGRFISRRNSCQSV